MREWLVGGEVALSTVLLVPGRIAGEQPVACVARGSRLHGRSRDRCPRQSPVAIPRLKDRAGFFDLALDRLRALPGVRSVAAVNKVPLSGESNVNSVNIRDGEDGALDPATKQLVMVNNRFVGARITSQRSAFAWYRGGPSSPRTASARWR